MRIVDNLFGLWWVALFCSAAGLLTLYGAMRGSAQHRAARIMLGVAVMAIALSYWWNIVDPGAAPNPAEMRRGAGVVLWPALLWTAWSGIRYATRGQQVEAAMRAQVQADLERREDDGAL